MIYIWFGSSRWPRARSATATVKLRLFAKHTKRQTHSQQARGGNFGALVEVQMLSPTELNDLREFFGYSLQIISSQALLNTH